MWIPLPVLSFGTASLLTTSFSCERISPASEILRLAPGSFKNGAALATAISRQAEVAKPIPWVHPASWASSEMERGNSVPPCSCLSPAGSRKNWVQLWGSLQTFRLSSRDQELGGTTSAVKLPQRRTPSTGWAWANHAALREWPSVAGDGCRGNCQKSLIPLSSFLGNFCVGAPVSAALCQWLHFQVGCK